MKIDALLELHETTCLQAYEIMGAKNHDYTSGSNDPFANFRASESIGVDPIVGVCVRIIDKLQRLRTFAEKGTLKVRGEGVADACRDIINYAVLVQGMAIERGEAGEDYVACKHGRLPEDCPECHVKIDREYHTACAAQSAT